MSSDKKTAISEAFSSRLASLRSMIDGLINSHSEERAFIAATLMQYSRDAGDIARQLPQEGVQNQSRDPPIGDTASTTAEASDDWQKWMIDLPDSPPLLDLLSEEFLDLNSGKCVDREHEADFVEVNNTLPRSSGHLRAGRIPGRSVTVPFNCENHFHTTTTENLRSTAPAVVHIKPIEEIEQRGFASTTPKSGNFACAQGTALTCIVKDRKVLEGTSDTIPHESTDGVDMPHLKKRGLTPSASGNELQKSRARKLRKQVVGSNKNLNDLYLATAGSEALCQLKGIIDAIRGISSSTLAVGPTTIAETLRMLDTLESFQHATAFLRRICFLKLWQLREILATRFTNDTEQRPDEDQPTLLKVGKSESNILDALTTEAFPEITPRPHTAPEVRKWRDKHEKERKSLKNRIQVAKKWHSLSKRFSCGILAAIPCGGQFEISNHKLETLSDNEFEKFLDLLERRPDNHVRRVAELLTPYVEAILNGQDYVQDSRLKMHISALINQDEVGIQPSGSILKEARITAILENDMALAISY